MKFYVVEIDLRGDALLPWDNARERAAMLQRLPHKWLTLSITYEEEGRPLVDVPAAFWESEEAKEEARRTDHPSRVVRYPDGKVVWKRKKR